MEFISREAAKQIALNRERHAKGETARACRGIAVAIDMLPAQAPAVSIKALVWEVHPYGLIAGASWGDAYIINTRGKGIVVIKGLQFNPEFDTIEAAKAAAQQDYESRILAALDLS